MTTPPHTRAGFLAIPGLLAPFTPPECLCCGIRMRSPLGRRDDDTREHAGRGLCTRCYSRRRYHSHCVAPRAYWKSRTALEEYEHFKDLYPTMTKQQIADRLGMKLKTLDRAISRGRKQRREHEAAEQLATEVATAELEAHRVNDDMHAYALRKAS